MEQKELDAIVQKFKADQLQPKIFTLGEEEKLDDCIVVDDRGGVRSDFVKLRRLTISMAYDIPEEDLTNIPGPVAKEMFTKARVANMTDDERETYLKAKEIDRLDYERVMKFLKDSASGLTIPKSKPR